MERSMNRLTQPRIAPLELDSLTESQRAVAGVGGSNVLRTLLRHEELLRPWLALGEKLLFSERIPPRERELAVLRVALRTESEYEWANHALAALAVGISVDEIRAVSDETATWSAAEGSVLRAVDELCSDDCVSDATWAALSDGRTDAQLMELLLLIGFYRMNAGMLNSLGVQPEAGRPPLGQAPEPPAARPARSAAAGDGHGTVDGTWRVVFHHPTGDQDLTLVLRSTDGGLAGSVANPALGVTIEILEGQVESSRFEFSAPIKTPVAADIRYTGVVEGDQIAGDIIIPGAGSFPFDGRRV